MILMSRSSCWTRRVVAGAAYALLAFATLEIAARVEDFVKDGAPLAGSYTINTLFQASPYGRSGVPGAHFGKWHMNAQGFRGPALREGSRRVLTFGASETFGIYEAAEGEYPRRLQALLDAAGAPVDVVNIALPGLRIGRVGYLEDAIRRTGAQVVLVYPTPANYIGATQGRCGRVSTPVPPEHGLGERLRMVGRIDQLAKRHVPPEAMDLLRRVMIWRETRHQVVMDQVPQASIQAFKDDLSCAVSAAQDLGARVVLATHGNYFGPTLEAAELPMMRTWRRFYPDLSEAGFIDLERRANEAIRALAQARGLALVDAAEALPPGPDYFADFVHFNDAGAQRMAAAAAPAVAGALGLPPPASAAP